MVAISSITLKQGIGHCVHLNTRRAYITYESHRTLTSPILTESILPSRVLLSLFKGSYPVSTTYSHAHPSQPSPDHFVLISHIFILSIIFRVDLWGIHQFPPSIDIFLSTKTHYLGIWSRNPLIPWILQSLVVGVLAFDSGLTPLIPFQMNLWVYDCSTSIHTP